MKAVTFNEFAVTGAMRDLLRVLDYVALDECDCDDDVGECVVCIAKSIRAAGWTVEDRTAALLLDALPVVSKGVTACVHCKNQALYKDTGSCKECFTALTSGVEHMSRYFANLAKCNA